MQYLELMMGSMIMNGINDFKTNIIFVDLFIMIFIITAFTFSRDLKISNSIKDYIHEYLFPSNNERRITFMFKRGEQSNRCKSLFHYLSNCNYTNSDVRHLVEDIFRKYDRYSDMDKEYSNIYRVDQIKTFNFTDSIKGRVFTEEKEAGEYNGKVTFKEFIHLVVYSETESLKTIQEFVEKCRISYNKFLKEQMLDQQYLITIENNSQNKLSSKSNNEDNDNLKISKEEWSSNVTFDTRFFPKKDKILKTIDHFLNNEKWYKEKGLNHTLGILLSGLPGCGKTSFIKALMNYTERHAIEVKLNDDFNFSDLKDIIYDEEIDDDIVIPQNKRIIIFEDIDAMGNIVKDRNLKEKENIDAKDKFKEEVLKYFSSDDNSDSKKNIEMEFNKRSDDFVKVKEKINNKENNNLSYLLNILDGINETPGRIIIMTTNKPEILDTALIRPGRIDLKINFGKSNEENLKEILYHYWKSEDSKDLSINENLLSELKKMDLSNLDEMLTPAEIIDWCRKNNSMDSTIKSILSIIADDSMDDNTDNSYDSD